MLTPKAAVVLLLIIRRIKNSSIACTAGASHHRLSYHIYVHIFQLNSRRVFPQRRSGHTYTVFAGVGPPPPVHVYVTIPACYTHIIHTEYIAFIFTAHTGTWQSSAFPPVVDFHRILPTHTSALSATYTLAVRLRNGPCVNQPILDTQRNRQQGDRAYPFRSKQPCYMLVCVALWQERRA